jgi:hypothetical protein
MAGQKTLSEMNAKQQELCALYALKEREVRAHQSAATALREEMVGLNDQCRALGRLIALETIRQAS